MIIPIPLDFTGYVCQRPLSNIVNLIEYFEQYFEENMVT